MLLQMLLGVLLLALSLSVWGRLRPARVREDQAEERDLEDKLDEVAPPTVEALDKYVPTLKRVKQRTATFSSLLKVSPLPDGRSWVLLERHSYYDLELKWIRVPEGFITDFASIPRPVWWWESPWGKHGNAAVLHDWLYWDQETTRAEADRIFLDAMQVLRVRVTKRYVMYYIVRCCGWWAWRTNANERDAGMDKVLTSGDRRGVTKRLTRLWKGKK